MVGSVKSNMVTPLYLRKALHCTISHVRHRLSVIVPDEGVPARLPFSEYEWPPESVMSRLYDWSPEPDTTSLPKPSSSYSPSPVLVYLPDSMLE